MLCLAVLGHLNTQIDSPRSKRFTRSVSRRRAGSPFVLDTAYLPSSTFGIRLIATDACVRVTALEKLTRAVTVEPDPFLLSLASRSHLQRTHGILRTAFILSRRTPFSRITPPLSLSHLPSRLYSVSDLIIPLLQTPVWLVIRPFKLSTTARVDVASGDQWWGVPLNVE